MPLAPGTRLGPYEILAPLGAGGMGEVYRARDARLGREVAVKVLLPAFAADTERLQRFEQEARAVSALNHPNILTLHDIGNQDGAPYLVMELLEGETLRARIASGLDAGRPITVKRAVEVAIAVARGLSAAHGKGILHRDLKPENVFVVKDGSIKILDFGLAKLQEGSPGGEAPTRAMAFTPVQSRTGIVMGTAGYMSPEQIRGEDLDPRSDLFSLGILLWEMLAGMRPFQGGSQVETLHAILKDELPELDLSLRVPPALERILQHCLAKDPEDRFHSARDLAFALETVTGSGAAPATATAAAQPAQPSPARRSVPAWVVPLAVAGAVAASLLAGWWWRPARPVFERLTPSPRLITSARWMPDGNAVVFASSVEGSEVNELALLSRGQPPQFLGVRQCEVLAVSPAGDIGLLLHGSTPRLAVRPAAGGAPRIVAEERHWQRYGITWTRDGKEMVILHGSYQDRPVVGIVFRGRLLYEAPWSHGIGEVVATPDGAGIAFLETRPSGRGLTVVELDGRQRFHRTLPEQETSDLRAQGRGYVAVETQMGGRGGSRLIDLDAEGRPTGVRQGFAGQPVLWDALPTAGLLISPAASQGHRELIRWTEPGSKLERVLSFGRRSFRPALHPAGDLLAFTQETAEGPQASVLRAGEAEAAHLGRGTVLALSPDGRQVLASVEQGPACILRLLPVGAGEARDLPQTWSSAYQAWFTPDGRGLVVFGVLAPAKAGQDRRAYRVDLASGSAQALPFQVRTLEGPISPDGRRIFCQRQPGEPGGWQILDLDAGTFRPIPERSEGLQKPCGWSPDGKAVWYYRWPVNRNATFPLELWRCELATGSVSKVRELPGPLQPQSILYNTLLVNPVGESCAYHYGYPVSVPTDLYRLAEVRR